MVDLPEPDGPDDRHEVAGEDLQRDLAQGVDLDLFAVDPRHVLELEQRLPRPAGRS